MSVVATQETVAPRPFAASLLPIMGVVFVGFLVVGVAMPVLPLYVHDGLGFGTFVVGIVAGSQFAASLISRPWAGHYSDGRGAKRAVVLGLLAASASGLLYLCSVLIRHDPEASVAVLLLGRAVLGERKVSSSLPRSVGDWRPSTAETPARSSRGWDPRCSPPSRSARRSALRSTPVTVL